MNYHDNYFKYFKNNSLGYFSHDFLFEEMDAELVANSFVSLELLLSGGERKTKTYHNSYSLYDICYKV